MSNSLETAQKIIDHLEGREAANRGLSGAIGRMQRREYNAMKQEIANLIDGKPAKEEKPAAAAADPRQGNLPATGNGGGSGNEDGKSPGKTSSGKAATA